MNDFITFNQMELANYFNMQPCSVKGVANQGVEFYKRLLYTKIASLFEFTIPTEWKINWLRFFLFQYGSIACIYTREYGWIIQPYGVTKLDINYNPKEIIVNNANLPESKTGVIGVNAGLIHCFDDYRGFEDIVVRYATDLANLDKSIEVNLMNCNATVLFEAENKKQADAMKEAYAEATTGKPFVAVSKEVGARNGMSPFFQSASSNFITDKLLQARRTIMNNFLTEIGIRNANYEKKERLNSAEVNENNDETRAIISVVFDNIKKDIEEINKISGLKLDVKLRYDYEVGGVDNELD